MDILCVKQSPNSTVGSPRGTNHWGAPSKTNYLLFLCLQSHYAITSKVKFNDGSQDVNYK